MSKTLSLIVFLEKIHYFCGMNEFSVVIISKSEELPQMACTDFFHSVDLFRIIEKTPGQKPYMAITYKGNDVMAHMLVLLRRRGSLFPPYLFTQGRAYGEGEYSPTCADDKETIFGMMLRCLIRKIKIGICLYIEFSDLSTKMFGYKTFRDNGFFPVHWMEIHNSLHSMPPAKRLMPRVKKQIAKARMSGLITTIADNEKEYDCFMKILRGRSTLKIRRFIPDPKLFHELLKLGDCKLFITRDGISIVSGCICVYSNENCYLWYLATKHKLHKKRASAMTVWAAILDAYKCSYKHIYFMDVGLPFKKNPFREFILGFGGKPVGTYRWFRCSFTWVNKILSWLYRE